jgi:apolipoprotein N-acyltransferase
MTGFAWKLLAVAVSAVLFVLALPPADWAPLGFFCFAPVLVAIRGKGFAWGFVAGMAVLLLGALLTWSGWFYEPSLTDAKPDWNFTGFALFGLVVGMSCAIVGEMKVHPNWLPWVLAAWAVLFESVLLLYIPAHIALTQYRIFPAMKLASVGGVWLVSYAVWVVNFHLAQGYVTKSRWTMALCGAFLGTYFGFAAFMGHPRSGTLRVGLVQTQTTVLDDLARLNAQATEEGAQVVVWPELSATYSAHGGDTTELRKLARQPGQAPFVTSFEDDNAPLPHNVAAIFSKDGESPRYNKRKLFGGERNVHAPGDEPKAATVGGVTYGLNICFDSCFPSVMRETAALDGVEVVLLPTQDPIGPYGTIQAFHAAYTPFRAAELGTPVLRADITAYSMAVDSRGVIVAELGPGIEGVLVAEVTPSRRATLYRRFGDWVLWACGAVALAGLVAGRKARRRPPESSLDAE